MENWCWIVNIPATLMIIIILQNKSTKWILFYKILWWNNKINLIIWRIWWLFCLLVLSSLLENLECFCFRVRVVPCHHISEKCHGSKSTHLLLEYFNETCQFEFMLKLKDYILFWPVSETECYISMLLLYRNHETKYQGITNVQNLLLSASKFIFSGCFFESPTNLVLNVVDIKKYCQVIHSQPNVL